MAATAGCLFYQPRSALAVPACMYDRHMHSILSNASCLGGSPILPGRVLYILHSCHRRRNCSCTVSQCEPVTCNIHCCSQSGSSSHLISTHVQHPHHLQWKELCLQELVQELRTAAIAPGTHRSARDGAQQAGESTYQGSAIQGSVLSIRALSLGWATPPVLQL